MIKMSAEVEEILANVLKEHGEAMLQCIMVNCVSLYDGNKISISDDCINALIELIEDKKKIALEEAQKEELKKLMQYQEEDLKRWFARLLGLKLTDAELLRMTVFQILNCKNGSKNAIDGEGSLFPENRSFEDDGRGQIKR